ncbi:methyltransferase [Rhizocola hellebori]|uniref:Methyltransferase n=1 Tax=Rhizocola hellebori TaxID=1392758 RepID=A0A8J3Q2K7_9ACTN|nr:methyltransferase domain-containing protein [Rhizocola hellebori]GIH02655.1 methyltransferase [Rhizocola hellebori]
MLTVDLGRMGIAAGDRVLDLGCGGGRHAFALYRAGAAVIALDQDSEQLAEVCSMFAALAGEVPAGASAAAVMGDALALPFADATFSKIVAAEVLEHIPDDTRAIAELYRVLEPGGRLAVTVPAWLPERICWALSKEYHTNPGGHVRIYTSVELQTRLEAAGFVLRGSHHAHGLHSPYWWLKCAVGVNNDNHPLPKAYHKMLVWDLMKHPLPTRLAERLLNPLIGKSLVVYADKPLAEVPNAA